MPHPLPALPPDGASMTEHLTAYITAGWSIIPVKPLDKRPLVKWAEFQTRRATLDEAQGWLAQWPDMNIGLVTGTISDIGVVDIDGQAGVNSLHQHKISFPATLTQKTPHGWHQIFALNGATVRNGAGILPHIDTRGDGGYIVVPPSRLSDGVYRWVRRGALADFPSILVAEKAFTPGQAAAPIGRVISGGQRNQTLASIAGTMRRRGLGEEAIAAALLVENIQHCDPPLTEREVQTIAHSIARYTPASPPPSLPINGQQTEPPVTDEPVHLTDLGNAQRMIALFGQDIRYCHPWESWLVWDGQRFRPDDTSAITQLAIKTVRKMYVDAGESPDPDIREKLVKHALASESNKHISAMLNLTKSIPPVPVRPTELDADIWSLNHLDGTTDLHSGATRAHQRRDLITKIAPVHLDATASCSLWLAFLDRIMDSDQDLISFLQRAVGYSLTGDISEAVMFILWGSGKNGKSTFLRVIDHILGDYAIKTPVETLLTKRTREIPEDIARLRGMRFVYASESDEGRRLSEAFIKDITGGEDMTARFLYSGTFSFSPTCKLWLGTNHKPVIKGTDRAIWERIRLIPFNVFIPEAERDHHLTEKLYQEAPGILAWAVEGCIAWQFDGLGTPEIVREATDKYRTESDALLDFVNDECSIEEGVYTTKNELFEAFLAWSKESGENVPMTKTTFGKRIAERGFDQSRTGKTRYWLGIKLKDAQ